MSYAVLSSRQKPRWTMPTTVRDSSQFFSHSDSIGSQRMCFTRKISTYQDGYLEAKLLIILAVHKRRRFWVNISWFPIRISENLSSSLRYLQSVVISHTDKVLHSHRQPIVLFGGTNWGQTAEPTVYSSYDYGGGEYSLIDSRYHLSTVARYQRKSCCDTQDEWDEASRFVCGKYPPCLS